MFYLEEFREAIAHKTEIRESDRGDYVVFDYMVALKDTFDSLEARNARGIAFDKETGHVISLPYDKFHNYNECPGWLESDIDLSKSHVILEKLDGSMIRTIKDTSGLGFHFGTRAGITDVSKQAWKFLTEDMDPELSLQYLKACEQATRTGFTLVFEYCAPDNRIVILYDQPQLILTAVRDNHDGTYVMYDDMVTIAKDYGIPVVRQVATEHSNISELGELVKNFVGSEGVVVRFDDGKMVKMKGLDYVTKHKALDGLRWEKDVLKLIFTGALDDVLPLVADDIRERLVVHRDYVLKNTDQFMQTMHAECKRLKEAHGDDRKAIVEKVRENRRSAVLMSLLGPKNRPENFIPFNIIAFIVGDKWNLGNLKTQYEVNDIRDIIGERSWYDYGNINVGNE